MVKIIVGIVSILLGLAANILINIITNDPRVRIPLRYAVGGLVGVVIAWLLVSSIPTDTTAPQAIATALVAPCSDFAASPVPGPSTLPLKADFSKWPTCDVPDVYHTKFDPTEPGYVFAIKTSGTHRIVRAPERYQYGDFTLDANVHRSTGGFFGNLFNSGTVLGLAFRIKPRQVGELCDSYYVFYVAPSSGRYALMQKTSKCDFDKVYGYVDSDKVDVFKDPKVNQLTVICKGDRITLKINGVEVYSRHDDIGGPGQIGVAAGIDETPKNIFAIFSDLTISP